MNLQPAGTKEILNGRNVYSGDLLECWIKPRPNAGYFVVDDGTQMKPSDVYAELKKIGATELFHANTVGTSSTFLEKGALLSRGFVEDNRLYQTPQSSDPDDKKYGIWHKIFLDHVDIHFRAGLKKGPNLYGPVLFVFQLDLLLELPAGSEVCVTRTNPIYWAGLPNEKRWFLTTKDLSDAIGTGAVSYGAFGNMLVVTTSSNKLDFPNGKARISLDDPARKMPSGKDAYLHATKRLESAAQTGSVAVTIDKHGCKAGCICTEKYAGSSDNDLSRFFA